MFSSSKTMTKRNLCHILKALVLRHSVKRTYNGHNLYTKLNLKNILNINYLTKINIFFDIVILIF